MSARIIKTCRGDSFAINVALKYHDNIHADTEHYNEPYLLTDNDVAYMGVMLPHQRFEDAIIKKRLFKDDLEEDGTITFNFNPEDTEDLDPGVYYYAVKVVQNRGMDNEVVSTIINKTKLVIFD